MGQQEEALRVLQSPDAIMNLPDGASLEEWVYTALGAASACWENLNGAGVFESTRARRIGEELVAYLTVNFVSRDQP